MVVRYEVVVKVSTEELVYKTVETFSVADTIKSCLILQGYEAIVRTVLD